MFTGGAVVRGGDCPSESICAICQLRVTLAANVGRAQTNVGGNLGVEMRMRCI